jgi:hypothetical protein
METREIFIGNRKEIVLHCRECGREKRVDLSNIENSRKKLRVTCVCGSSYKAVLERRLFYRKMASLFGYFTKVAPDARPDHMTVVNLSRGGLAFKTIGNAKVEEGDLLRIEFNLDTEHRTPIIRNVTVRYVRDNYVGAAFYSLDENTKKSLGFYLLP